MFTCLAFYISKENNFCGACMNILVLKIWFCRHFLQMLKCCLEQPLGYFLHQLQLITCLSANSGLHSVIYFKVKIMIQHNAFFVGAYRKIHVLIWLVHVAQVSDVVHELCYQMVNFLQLIEVFKETPFIYPQAADPMYLPLMK